MIINQTKKYLLPTLKYYGLQYISHVNKLHKLFVGTNDYLYDKCNIPHPESIFVLVDVNQTKLDFNKVIDYFRNHESYVNDYAHDLVHKGHEHVFVFKIPYKYINSYNQFKASMFSKMYESQDIIALFSPAGRYKESRAVFTGDPVYRNMFIKRISEMFDMTIAECEKNVLELDFPYNKELETLNYRNE